MDRAHALARHLAGRGIHVVSGGALGIDGAAHRGALAGGGTTTVVLGNGCDIAYPDRHAALFARVLRDGGALVSRHPDGTTPRRGMFLARNPLIAALADLCVVVEADARSGSLVDGACRLAFRAGGGGVAGEPRLRAIARERGGSGRARGGRRCSARR